MIPRFGRLRLDVAEDGGWVVAEPFEYQYEPDEVVRVMPGFRTDLVSAPRIARPLIRTWGRYTKPAVAHDHDYRMRRVPRKVADRRFLAGMEALGVSWLMRRAMYAAVRSFGWLAYY